MHAVYVMRDKVVPNIYMVIEAELFKCRLIHLIISEPNTTLPILSVSLIKNRVIYSQVLCCKITFCKCIFICKHCILHICGEKKNVLERVKKKKIFLNCVISKALQWWYFN